MIVGTAEVLVVPITKGFEKELKDSTAPAFGTFKKDAEVAGESAGFGMRTGVTKETGKLAGDVEKHGVKAGESLHKGMEGGITKVAGALQGLPVSPIQAIGAATVIAAGAAVDLGEKMQSADAKIAGASGTSVASATKIGDAFLGTGFKAEFSGQQMATAFAGVAGQLKATEGHALNAKQSLEFMTAASDLAAAKQIDLGTATSATAGILQAFQLRAQDAAHVTDVLFNASNATGQGVDALGGQLEKVRSKLGDVAPPLGDLAGLMVDMTEHGITGRAALGALNTSLNGLIKPSKDGAKEIKTLGLETFDSQGKFVGLGSVIDQLHPKFATMTQAQQLQAAASLFGAGAARQMTAVINAGPAAYDKATASVNRHGAAQQAAAQQATTLHGQIKTLQAGLTDLATKIGAVLIPVITSMVTWFVNATTFVTQHKAVLIILAGVVTGILAPAIAVFTINKMAAFGQSFITAGGHVTNFAGVVKTVVGKIIALFVTQGAATETLAATSAAADAEMVTAADTSAIGIKLALGSTGIGLVLVGLGAAAVLLQQNWSGVMSAMTTAVQAMVSTATGMLNSLIGVVNSVIDAFNSTLGQLTGQIGHIGSVGSPGGGGGATFNTPSGNAPFAPPTNLGGAGSFNTPGGFAPYKPPTNLNLLPVPGLGGAPSGLGSTATGRHSNIRDVAHVAGIHGAGDATASAASAFGVPPTPQAKAIVAAAAAKYGIAPELLWGVYGTETTYGANVHTSSTGAQGPFQIEPGTARTLGVDPNNFTQAAYGAAHYLSQYASRGTAGMLSAYNAGPNGGIQSGYVSSVLRDAATFGHVSAAPATSTPFYVDPLGRAGGVRVGRTDMGVDYSANPGSPIDAVGAGKIVSIIANWYKGQPLIEEQLTSGPRAGQFVYYAEQLNSLVKQGQAVRAGQQIGTVAAHGTGLELGFGAPGGRTLAQATTGYREGQITPAGQQFAQFISSVKAGTAGSVSVAGVTSGIQFEQATAAQTLAAERAQLAVTIKQETAALNRKIAAEKAGVAGKGHTGAEKAAVAQTIADQKSALAIEIAQQKGALGELTARQAAELKKQTSDAKAGTSELTKLLTAIHSGKLADLQKAINQAHQAGLKKIESDLNHDHSAALATLSKELVAVHSKAMAALVKAQADARNAAWLTSQTAALDAANTITADTAKNTATRIADATKVYLDQQAETGKAGADLIAAQAQTALDRSVSAGDEAIGQAQLALDRANAAPPDLAHNYHIAQANETLARAQANATITQAQAQSALDKANAAATAADAAASAAAANATTSPTTAPPATPATPVFNFTVYGSLPAGQLFSEAAWAIRTGALPVAPPATPGVPVH